MDKTTSNDSPLKRLTRPETFESKFTVDIARLFSLTSLDLPPSSFYTELFCLNVQPNIIINAVKRTTEADLLGPLHGKISGLFVAAVDQLSRGHDKAMQSNAVDVRRRPRAMM